jgi:hypothetical protein
MASSPPAMLEVMVNMCFGGFGLSQAAMDEYRRRCPSSFFADRDCDIPRHDAVMVQIVKDLGSEAASARHASVQLRRIPSEYVRHYTIEEYDGMESVALDRAGYVLDAARAILRDRAPMTKAERLARLAAVLLAEERDADGIH